MGGLLTRPNLTHDYAPWVQVPREPVSTFIGLSAVLFNTGLFASVGAAAAFGGTIVVGGVLAGAQFALSKTIPKPNLSGFGSGSAADINAPASRGSIRQNASPQRRIYGRMQVGGAWIFYDDATPQYQYLTLGLARGRISAIRAVIINNNRVTFSSTAFDTIVTPVAVDGQDYAGNLEAAFGQGLDTQTKCPLLDAHFPASGSEIVFDSSGINVVNLPSTYRQRGIARATFRAKFGSTQDIFFARWGHVSFISPLIELDGHPVFDPRNPACDIDDESTYIFSYDGHDSGRNVSLVQCNWLTQPYGGRLRTDQIRIDELIESANHDDDVVPDRDGNLRVRHQCDCEISLSDNPRHVTEAMMTAAQNWIVNSRGRVGWVPTIPKDPEIVITESDIRGGFDYRDDAAKRDIFNRVRTRFNPPEKNYTTDDGPVIDRADLRTGEDGDELLDTTVTLSCTTDQRAAQWLGGQFLEASRVGRALDIPALRMTPRLLKGKIGTIVQVAMRKRYTEINGIYQIMQDGFSNDFSRLAWSLREYDKSVYTKNRAPDQKDFQVATAA